jgi:exodeoxyribonuclease VII large subunit
VDVLISDHVADLRAPTPSAAIEMILPDQNEILILLDTYIDQMTQGFAQRIRQKEQHLYHLEMLLFQSAPLKKLEALENTFGRLHVEYTRVMKYLLIQKSYLPARIKEQFGETEYLYIQQQQALLGSMEKMIKMNDPRHQYKQGWARLFKEKHLVTLKEIEVEDRFILEDATVIMEAVCLNKKEI